MRQKNLQGIFIISLTVFVGILVSLIGYSRIADKMHQSTGEFAGLLILLVTLTGLVFIWVAYTFIESTELGPIADKRMGIGHRLFGVILGISVAVGFALLVMFITDIPIFLFIYGVITLATAIADSMIVQGLLRELQSGRTKTAASGTKKIAEYYLSKPHILKHATQLFIILTAAIIYTCLVMNNRQDLDWIVYIMVSVSIWVQEVIIWKWRMPRFKSRKVESGA
jgi:hypothetical protein